MALDAKEAAREAAVATAGWSAIESDARNVFSMLAQVSGNPTGFSKDDLVKVREGDFQLVTPFSLLPVGWVYRRADSCMVWGLLAV